MSVWTLAAFAGGFLVLGYLAGLGHGYVAMGFFLSLKPAEDITHVLATAEARILRRKARDGRRRPIIGSQHGRHLPKVGRRPKPEPLELRPSEKERHRL